MGLYFLFRGYSGVFASGGRCVAGLSLKRGACGIAVWKVCQRCAEGWALERGRGEVGGILLPKNIVMVSTGYWVLSLPLFIKLEVYA